MRREYGDQKPIRQVRRTDCVAAYEINEGYDTDGDGISDLVELTSNGIFRGDPQTLRTPDREQAAYFGHAY